MKLVAALSGALIFGGLAVAIMSWKPVPVAPCVRSARSADPLLKRRVSLALVAAVVVFVVTRWPVGTFAGAGVGWVAAGFRGRKEREIVERRTESIALWTEMLRDAIGTARGIEGVLVATAATGPMSIRPELKAMAERLQHETLDRVLDQLAADLDHPLGDLVVTALRLTSTSGSRQVRDVLQSLAAAAYAEAESHRRIEVARERPRAAMKYSAILIGGFISLLAVFSGSYLAPYRSPLGQVVLAVVVAYWTIGFVWMNRMGRPDPVERFLAPVAAGVKQ